MSAEDGQLALALDLETQAAPTDQRAHLRPTSETQRRGIPSPHVELVSVADAVRHAQTGLAKARLLLQLERLVSDALACAIADAYRSHRSWRKLSADLGIPFQTLHRRYGTAGER